MGIRARLLLVFIPTVLALFGALAFIGFRAGEVTLRTQINFSAQEVARASAREFDVLFASARRSAKGVASALAVMENEGTGAVEDLLRRTVGENESIFGSAAAFVPGATAYDAYAPYLHRAAGGLTLAELATPSYDYAHQPWFTRPIAAGRGIWTEPYFDRGGGDVLMITYATPIVRGGRVIGVATVDIALGDLIARVRKLAVSRTGFSFIVSAEGRFIAHPAGERLSQTTIWQLADEGKDPAMNRLARYLRTPDENFEEMIDPFTHRPSCVITTYIESVGWTLVVVYPRDEILEPLARLRYGAAASALAILALVALLVLWFSAGVTGPLARLVGQARRYGAGDFSGRQREDAGPREVRELAGAFNRLGDEIVTQIDEVRRTTAQAEDYRHELRVAADLQQRLLPREAPPVAGAARPGLCGLMRPAREVGGDYFDYFAIDGDRIGFVVADVSDKGAAASLFMAMTRTLIRETAARGFSPGEVLRRVNDRLARDNEASMFVTVLYGDCRPSDGTVRIACAGHPPPLLCPPGGGAVPLTVVHAPPLAALPGTRYGVASTVLAPGALLLCYTDGVTEAADRGSALFGEARLRDAAGAATGGVRDVIDAVLRAVDDFARGEAQADDITLLALSRPPSGPDQAGGRPAHEVMFVLEIPPLTDLLATVSAIVTAASLQAGFDGRGSARLAGAVDEVVANAVLHGGGGEDIRLEFAFLDGGISIAVIDRGAPFDFAAAVKEPPPVTVESAPGGRGLHIARTAVDDMRYEPGTPEGNRLTLVKRLPAGR